MKLNWTSNNEFHIEKSQTEEGALEALERFPESFPKDLQCFIEPLLVQ
jgi:hypothetical protein